MSSNINQQTAKKSNVVKSNKNIDIIHIIIILSIFVVIFGFPKKFLDKMF